MVRGSRVGASLLALCAVLAAPSLLRSARAQEATWSLVWEAPGECPSEANVREAVAELLGTGGPPSAPVSASAVVERISGDRWVVQLTTVREGARGERVVEATSCPSLARATALIVALTIDPERVAAHTPGSTADASARPSGSVSTPTTAAADGAASSVVPPSPSTSAGAALPSPPPRDLHHADDLSSRPPAPIPTGTGPKPPSAAAVAPPDEGTTAPSRVALLLQGMGDVGSLPHFSDGLAGGLALTLDRLRIEAFGAYLFAQPADSASLPSVGTNLDLVVGGLRGCYLPHWRNLELGACAGLELGQLQGSGFGSIRSPYETFTPSSGGSLWVAPLAGGRIAWRIAPSFSLVIDLGVAVPLERDAFVITNSGTLHQASAVVGRGAAGPEVRF